MSGFRTVVKIIENHLTEYSTTEFKAANSPWPLNHTYALVCGDNQTYYVGFTQHPGIFRRSSSSGVILARPVNYPRSSVSL